MLLAIPPFSELVRLYDYDASARLDGKTDLVSDRDGITIRKLESPSPKGGTATGYLVDAHRQGSVTSQVSEAHSGSNSSLHSGRPASVVCAP